MVLLELKKIKRTGLIPAFLMGGLLAAGVPILNMFFRSDIYLSLPDTPLQILLKSNWQMMAMLNILLIISGACLMYYSEFLDNAIQKMKSLPIKESNIYLWKAAILASMYLIVLVIEAGILSFIISYWFSFYPNFEIELLKNFGFLFLMGLPSILLALLIASLFKNMWFSLGIGVVAVFMGTVLSSQSFILSLFPFAMPLQTLGEVDSNQVVIYIYVALIEITIIALVEWLILIIRRKVE